MHCVTKCGEITVSRGIYKSAQNDEQQFLVILWYIGARPSVEGTDGSTLEESEVRAIMRSIV